MRLLTWNLRHGGGPRRMPAIALAILEHRPDVVILTEYRRTTGGQIAGVLADHGLRHQSCTEPARGKNGILVAARIRIRSGPCGEGGPLLVSDWSPGTRPGSQRLTEVEFPDIGLGLAALHIPPNGDRTREAVFQDAVRVARERRDGCFFLMGDFNAGRHHLDEGGATFTCTRLLGTIATMGYVDAWRTMHPLEREYTWFSHEGAGFRIDHCFLSAPLSGRLSACWHSHRERMAGLSDHSMLLVGLD